MKKQYVSLLAVILAASGFLFSCGDKMKKDTGSLEFDSIQVNKTVHLFGDTSKPACNLLINFVYPSKSSDELLKDTLDKYFIAACFGDKYMGEKPQEVVKQYTETYISEYRRDLEPMYLEDEKDKESSNDFGKNIIPKMLNEGRKLVAYPFKGYWKDVGTISSLWEANMDLLKRESGLNLYEDDWKIYSVSPVRPAQYIGKDANVKNSLIVEGCTVHGTVENSVLFEGVYIGKNTVIRDSVIMTDAKIGDNVVIDKAIIGGEAKIRKDCKIGNGEKISVIASKEDVKSGTVIDAMEV